MHSFKSYITERVLSIGLNPEHEQFREKHRQEIHDILHHAYSDPMIGGYGGHKSGSKEESNAIHSDISNSLIKATKRDGKITSVNLYKKQHGRKSVASGTDGSIQGKKDYLQTKLEDHEQKRAWGEVSGKVEHLQKKIGVPVIPRNKVGKLLNKSITPHGSEEQYSRSIGGKEHVKTAMGYPKDE
jgi:hypothetical protein